MQGRACRGLLVVGAVTAALMVNVCQDSPVAAQVACAAGCCVPARSTVTRASCCWVSVDKVVLCPAPLLWQYVLELCFCTGTGTWAPVHGGADGKQTQSLPIGAVFLQHKPGS